MNDYQIKKEQSRNRLLLNIFRSVEYESEKFQALGLMLKKLPPSSTSSETSADIDISDTFELFVACEFPEPSEPSDTCE